MKGCPEGNLQKLADQLTGIKISKKPTSNKTNCTSCGKAGHLKINCWWTCPACNQSGHRPRLCELSVQERRKVERSRKRKLKLVLKNLASEDTTLPILLVGGADITTIMPPKLI